MKYIFIIALMLPVFSFSQTGRTIMGPKTMGQPSYPNSGQTRNRSNDITGKDMSNATLMSSDSNPTVPSRNLLREREIQREEIKEGPYRDNNYYFKEEGPEGKKAQRAAEKERFDIPEKVQKRKQHGY